MSPSIEVVEAYRGYAPRFDARRTVTRLLRAIPQRYVAGIGAVVLSNVGALNREQRRRKSKSRGRKVGPDQILGRYHPAWNGERPWIELFVDQMFNDCPRWLLYIPPIRDAIVGDTLFHEIGHHIHRTQEPEYREKEKVADKWVRRLGRRYFRRQYWYLTPLALMLFPVAWVARWLHGWKRRDAKRITTA